MSGTRQTLSGSGPFHARNDHAGKSIFSAGVPLKWTDRRSGGRLRTMGQVERPTCPYCGEYLTRGAGPYSHPDARYGILMWPCAAIGPNDYRLSREAIMNKNLLVSILMALTVTAAAAQAPTKDALIARAKSFELDTPYVPPPGDPLTHHAARFSNVLRSAVFMTRLAPDFAAENVGFFTAPYAKRP